MRKGIRIDAVKRDGESYTWIVKNVYLGKIYDDESFGELLRLYTDETGKFQIQFLRGSDLSYTFLPQCTELLNILEEGIIGVSLGMIADELLQQGYEER